MLLGIYVSNCRVRVPSITGRVLASCHNNVRPLALSSQTRDILSRRRIHPLSIQTSRFYATETPSKKTSGLTRFLPSALQPAPGSSSSFRKIVALAAQEKKPLLLAVGLLLVSSSVAMSVPFTIGKLIDFFSSSNPEIPFGLSVGQASAALLILFTTGATCNAARSFLMRMSGQRIVARLRERSYAAALRQEVEFVERGEGDVLSRLTADSSIVGESVTQNLSDGLRAIVMSSVGLGAMFYLSPTLTVMMLGIVPPVSLGAVFYGRYLKRLSNQTQEAMGELTKVAQESLSALRTVQAFNARDQEEAKFHDRVTHVLGLARKEAVASGIFFGSTGWSGNVTMLGLLGYGGTLVSQGAITVGDLTSLLLYTVYVGSGLQMLTSFFSSIMRGIGAGSRIFELLDRTPAIPPRGGIEVDASRYGTVRFENIGFEYPSRKGVQILDDFNLEVGVGESVAIVGKSGGGKSSIQSLLLRYYDPVRGKVTFDGQDIREFNPSSWRSIIGIVPQDPVLFTGTIASNIAFGCKDATREDIEAAAREANCEFILGMPKGLDTEIGRLSLSGGQRQRLAIARALLKKPKILALDEATSSLDAASEHRVNDAIDKILRARHTTCLIVAHRLSTIARAERIVVLEDGRITESGTYRQLVNTSDSRFRALMAAQLNTAAGDAPLPIAPSTNLDSVSSASLGSALPPP
ncbi:P-loop containing nucleoside triphosphate hydrolase protein [Suillus clintonianus]|uniref:P-loop containing nucleoside triphosphate hydrolase protein n=1 Tax=Suillus clintonianus TaxID=1904413 RepID=UPI001B86DBCB|nr:P-loop containing nucleoside triphosphate hydrolase protein [Suillus clintonianus]KAG2153205.1 P-loop containing nucleoside triphosphate hydrolase protein [Suillus clintonianus]